MGLDLFWAEFRTLEYFRERLVSGGMDHNQADHGEEEKQRMNIAVEPALCLPSLDRLGQAEDLLARKVSNHARAQQPVFAEDFAHPGGRHPWLSADNHEHATNDAPDGLDWIVRWIYRAPHLGEEGKQAVLDYGVNQIVTIAEVVVDHGRRHSGAFGHHCKSGRGNSVLAEQGRSSVDELNARVAVWVGLRSTCASNWLQSLHN